MRELSILCQHRHKLNNASTETLRGIVHEFLLHADVDYHQTRFHANMKMSIASDWRNLTSEVIKQRNQATI